MHTATTSLADFARLLADDTRARFCLALLDGRAWTAGELARHAGVAPATTTEHLNRLVAGGLLAEQRQGRHRYVRLADPAVAELLESLLAHLGSGAAKPRTLRSATAADALARGRTCYDHLAGRLGVAITDAMEGEGLLVRDTGFALTEAGIVWLTDDLGIPLEDLRGTRRPLVKACLDWTERRPHLAGAAGALLCTRFRRKRWIRTIGSGRAVSLTPSGERALRDLLGLDAAAVLRP